MMGDDLGIKYKKNIMPIAVTNDSFILYIFRPLHEAVENGDVHLVRLLLSYGADPRLATYSGQSPLSLATDKQTRMLLENHVNDILGHGSASVWNFEDFELNRKHINNIII